MKTLLCACLGLATLLCGGCAAKLTHTEINNDAPAGTAVNGIPYRVAKRYRATVYEKTDNGYKEIHSQPVTMPDPNRIYVLGFESQPFSSASIELQMYPDNTIQKASINSTSTGQAALTALGAQVNAVTAAELARRTTETTRATTEQTAITNAQSLLIKATKAYQDAEVAVAERVELAGKPDTTLGKLTAAYAKEIKAKLDANEAARQAVLPPYYPDVIAGASVSPPR